MQRDINFFTVYNSPLDNKSDVKGVDNVTLIGTVIVIACIVVVLAVFGAFKLFDEGQTLQINNYNNYFNGANVGSAQNAVSADTNKINAYNNYTNAVSGAYSQFQALPVPDSTIIASISKALPKDITVTNITYSSSIVTMQCISTSKQSPENFAHALKMTDGFDNVVYTGFVINDKNQYTFNITFTVSEVSSK